MTPGAVDQRCTDLTIHIHRQEVEIAVLADRCERIESRLREVRANFKAFAWILIIVACAHAMARL